MKFDKKPLYRKIRNNESFAHYHNRNWQRYKHSRNTKKVFVDDEVVGLKNNTEKMSSHNTNGYDYTPLFKFLQSKVGQNWNEIYSEAKSRLDKEEPIWWIVQKTKLIDGKRLSLNHHPTCYLQPIELFSISRIGESTYWRGLYIDENNVLQYIDKNATYELHKYDHWTHTLDGKVILKK